MNEPRLCWGIKQQENKYLLYIYDEVTEYGEFDWNTWNYKDSETSAKYFRDQLDQIPDGSTIELHINSDGGSVKEGTAIYNLLKSKNCTVNGIVDGVAHSIAFLILQACDHRAMCLGTSALIHNMWMYCYGNASQLRKYADDLDALSESNRQVFLERASISEEVLVQLMDAETYLTPDSALEYGLIDEILNDSRADPEGMQQKLMQQNQLLMNELKNQKAFQEQLLEMKKQKEPKATKKILHMFETWR